MGLSKNTLDRSDISTYPIKLKYSATYYSSSAYDYGITLNRGVNTSFDSSSIQFLNYALVRQLYYQEYITGSLLNSASYWDPSLQSTAATGTSDNDYRYFPIDPGSEITVMAIPRTVFGENIGRKSLVIEASNYRLIDDGNGNILDSNNGNVHVGNILYSQGIIVITNLSYKYTLIDEIITTTSTTTTTTTVAPTTSTTTTTTTSGGPSTTTTSTTSTTTTEPPTTTTTTTSTTSTTSTTTTSTTTTTTTAPPTTTTTTSTTTTTTTVGDVNITLYARQDPAASTFPSVQFAYSTDGGSSWTNVGSSFTDTTCSQRAVVTVQQGSSLSIKISDAGNVNNTWQSARDTSTCPSFTSTACTWSALTNINRTYYFTMNGDNQGVC
jgi:hypothetical protein